jgi:hypothetical protein
MTDLSPDLNKRLEEIRDAERRRSKQNIAVDPNDIGFSEQGDARDDGSSSGVGYTARAVSATSGASDSGIRWLSSEARDGSASSHQDELAPSKRDTGTEGDREERGRNAVQGGYSLNDTSKPQGFVGVPSQSEQAERPQTNTSQEESPFDIIQIIAQSKDGKRQRVRRRDRKLVWRDTPSASTPTGPKVVVDNSPPVSPKEKEPSPLEKMYRGTVSKLKGVLTEREADEMLIQLEDALPIYLDTLDKVFIATLKGNPQLVFFGDIDEADTHFLCVWQIDRARKDDKVATGVRAMVESYRMLKAGQILLPRFFKVWQAYNDFGFEIPGGKAWKRQSRAYR